ncbi:glycosyltransferase family 2 protein [Lichenihabitans sp. Uapishka_5]|uniref:glycosyltransferase family 2 protein n=1 Tax=Lichenihabitans sp. Uapishka_5 TaxID=3037302 RepID=UPI0029E7F47A|nr:glycosyltransferase family 2 protein [Lichenihabitans sp. Uapishka_5]MDX7952791.1 glycosyltransferase family 2 protein [Lichenihabitans sp. Uapishka_5]
MAVDADAQRAGGLRLSIIISCFNYQAFVGRAIDSVVSQMGPDCELIVVDDGSTDESWPVIEAYRLPKAFRVANGGALAACRQAFARAEAPFVLFLDADDALVPGGLARILPHLRPGLAKLQFPLIPIDADGQVLGAASPALRQGEAGARLRREVLATGCYNSPPTSGNVFCRALCEILAEVDYETWVDGVIVFAAPFFGTVVSLAEPLGYYRLHGRNGSQSGSRPDAARFGREAERFLRRHEHLRRILAARNEGGALVEGASAFFPRERRLYQTVLEGRAPRLRHVLALQRLLVGMARPLPHKLSMSVLFWLVLVLPRPRRDALLAYRLQPGHRSAWGGLRQVLRPDPAAA